MDRYTHTHICVYYIHTHTHLHISLHKFCRDVSWRFFSLKGRILHHQKNPGAIGPGPSRSPASKIQWSQHCQSREPSLWPFISFPSTLYVYIPGTQLASIFEGQPPKTRPSPTKIRVIWVLGIYTYIHTRGSCLFRVKLIWWSDHQSFFQKHSSWIFVAQDIPGTPNNYSSFKPLLGGNAWKSPTVHPFKNWLCFEFSGPSHKL